MNDKNVKYFAYALNGILKTQEIFTIIKSIEPPEVGPAVYVSWHSDQFCVYGIPARLKEKLNVLISNSLDGSIIDYCVRNLGMKTIRGSAGRKGSVGGTMQMLEALKKGESVALMVDGPHGPLHKVKGGALKLAQMAQVPIVPVHWYSPQFNFVKIPSWDSMTSPLGYTRVINIYGEPIYVPQEMEAGDEQFYKEKIKQALLDLDEKAPRVYQEVKHELPWKLNLDLKYQRYN